MPSTVISKVKYDAGKERLTIGFVSGRVYDYFSVPLTVYSELISAPSKGVYFNEQIKGAFDFEQVITMRRS